MKLQKWMLALLCCGGASLAAADVKTATDKGDPRAAALMAEAAKTRYTWSPDVTAVSGKFSCDMDGKAVSGTFRSTLHQRGGFKIDATGDAEILKELKDHIGSLISHRTAPSPGKQQAATPPATIVVEDDAHGPLIMIVGDPMNSTQRVKDGKMVQVNRQMGGKRFTIDVTEFEKSADGRYYPSAFTVTWWEASTGKKVEKQAYSTQGFHTTSGQLFPQAEKVVSEKDGKTSTLAIHYSDIKFDMAPQSAERK
ncbi:MAG TPA: DUF3386 family protein [Gemmataceae bacterium]|nr:DUF3386 family protein [Gemmataceae bacterium]